MQSDPGFPGGSNHFLHRLPHLQGMAADVYHKYAVMGSQHFQASLAHGLAALQEPIVNDLSGVLNELQLSTRQMHAQQEKFLYRLRSAQTEIQHLRNQLERAQAAATLDSLPHLFNRHAFTRLLEKALSENSKGLALVMLDITISNSSTTTMGIPSGTESCSMSANCCANSCLPAALPHAKAVRSSA